MSAFILHTVGFVIGLTTLAIGMCSYITHKLSEIMQKEGKGRGKEEPDYYAIFEIYTLILLLTADKRVKFL